MSTENTDFSRTLSLLRKEKHISQRSAAAAMGISQALLSHYENGVREPGLAFVVKACDFYQVSADYLLGRTMAKDGTIIEAQDLYDVSEQKDNSIRGNVTAQLNKKLIVNAVSLIYALLGALGNRQLIVNISDYLTCVVYTLFRNIYCANHRNVKGFFALDDADFFCGAVDASMARSRYEIELELVRMGRDKTAMDKLEQISPETIREKYPILYQSLLQVLHNTNGRIKKRLAAEKALK